MARAHDAAQAAKDARGAAASKEANLGDAAAEEPYMFQVSCGHMLSDMYLASTCTLDVSCAHMLAYVCQAMKPDAASEKELHRDKAVDEAMGTANMSCNMRTSVRACGRLANMCTSSCT